MTDLRAPDFSRLIPIEEYIAIEHDVPYQYALKQSDLELQIFGADHSNDPAHKQFLQLKELVDKNKPTCVLLEGLQDEVTFTHLHDLIAEMGEEEAIMRGGESVYAAHLALQNGVTWQSLEPADKDLYEYLEGLGFSREEIVTWSILRLIPQYLRRDEMVMMEDYLEPFRAQFAEATGWSEARAPMFNIVKWAHSIIGVAPSFTNEDKAMRYVSPLAVAERDNDYTVLNTIAATAANYRDRAMVKNITKAMQDFDSVLAVYGASHAVIQEPVFRSLMDE